MATFVFRAKPGLPRDKGGYRLLFRAAGRRSDPKKGGKDALLMGPDWLYDGDECDATGGLESIIRKRYSHLLHEKPEKMHKPTKKVDAE